MLRIMGWVELLASILFLSLTAWSVSSFCSGRVLGNDCESWFILGVNIFGPLGLLALACSIWTLKIELAIPQYILVLGATTVIIYWFSHVQ
jgi:hypothetical protein